MDYECRGRAPQEDGLDSVRGESSKRRFSFRPCGEVHDGSLLAGVASEAGGGELLETRGKVLHRLLREGLFHRLHSVGDEDAGAICPLGAALDGLLESELDFANLIVRVCPILLFACPGKFAVTIADFPHGLIEPAVMRCQFG